MTITSEGRETWAAGSLRGFVVWVWFWLIGMILRERNDFGWLISDLDDEVRRDTDGHVSKFIALWLSGSERRETDCLSCWPERMCLELVKNTTISAREVLK